MMINYYDNYLINNSLIRGVIIRKYTMSKKIRKVDKNIKLLFAAGLFISLIIVFGLILGGSPYPKSPRTDFTGRAVSAVYGGFGDPGSRFGINAYNFTFNNDTDTAYVTLNINDYVIYNTAYVSFDGQNWQEFNLTPIGEVKNNWFRNSATATIAVNKNNFRLNSTRNETSENYIIIYTCSRDNIFWDCHDGWQIVNFKAILKRPPVIDIDNDGYSNIVDCNDNNANVNPGRIEVCGNGVDDDCSSGDSTCSVPIPTNDLCNKSSVTVTSCYSHFNRLNMIVDGNYSTFDDSFDGCTQSPEWWQFTFVDTKSLSRIKFLEKNFYDGWIASSPLYYVEYQDTNNVWRNVSGISRNPTSTIGKFNGGSWNEINFTSANMKAFRLRFYSSGAVAFTGLSEVECFADSGATSCSDGVMNGNETGIDCGGQCGACIVTIDLDSDGYNSTVDCNDTNNRTWQSLSVFTDSDSDNYVIGSSSSMCIGTIPPTGYVLTSLGIDCNDNNINVNPGRVDICDNGIDDDCSGGDTICPVVAIDLDSDGYNSTVDCNDNDASLWIFRNGYVDIDRDSYTIGAVTQLCSGNALPSGYSSSSLGADCNDNSASVWTLRSGYVDVDHDGYTIGSVQQLCSGSNLPTGYNATSLGADCNDVSSSVWIFRTGYTDSDSDTYTLSGSSQICSGASLPTGYRSSLSASLDCDDSNFAIKPSATDICGNGIDEDCSGTDLVCTIDTDGDGHISTDDCNDNDASKWQYLTGYTDSDADTYTLSGSSQICSGASLPSGYRSSVSSTIDCNDVSSSVWIFRTGYTDSDNDGYTVGSSQQICSGASLPSGYKSSSLGTDCNDNDVSKWQNLAGYVDSDLDTYTASSSSTQVCTGASLPSGYRSTTSGVDCNDNNANINPGKIEVCGNGIDEDCSGSDLVCSIVDLDSDGVASGTDCNDNNNAVWIFRSGYADADHDGYTVGTLQQVCSGATLLNGYNATSLGTDCLDTNANVRPGKTEICGNGLDDDCSGGDLACTSTNTTGNMSRITYFDASPYDYGVYLPPGYNLSNNTGRTWPLLIFLHGSGERGADMTTVTKVATNGPLKVVKAGKDFDMIIIAPQTDAWGWGYLTDTFIPTDKFVNQTFAKYRVDRTRVYMTGLSMGGGGSWDYAINAPDKITAIIPIASGTNYRNSLCNLKNNVAVWAFHNVNDSAVPSYNVRTDLIPKLDKGCGAPYNSTDAKYTQYEAGGHGGWTQTYDGTGIGTANPNYDPFNESIYVWMLRHHKQCDENNNCVLAID